MPVFDQKTGVADWLYTLLFGVMLAPLPIFVLVMLAICVMAAFKEFSAARKERCFGCSAKVAETEARCLAESV